MSALGIFNVALFFAWFVLLAACIYLFIFKKRKLGVIAGILSLLCLTGFSFLVSGRTNANRTTETLVQKALTKVKECRALGDQPITHSGRILIWHLNVGRAADPGFFEMMDPNPRDEPVTVFLISPQYSLQIGTYSVSQMPALREWFEVYVVQFRGFSDDGTAIAMHKFVSSDPASERIVTNKPEYGGSYSRPVNPNGPLKPDDSSSSSSSPPNELVLEREVMAWIDSLPTQ